MQLLLFLLFQLLFVFLIQLLLLLVNPRPAMDALDAWSEEGLRWRHYRRCWLLIYGVLARIDAVRFICVLMTMWLPCVVPESSLLLMSLMLLVMLAAMTHALVGRNLVMILIVPMKSLSRCHVPLERVRVVVGRGDRAECIQWELVRQRRRNHSRGMLGYMRKRRFILSELHALLEFAEKVVQFTWMGPVRGIVFCGWRGSLGTFSLAFAHTNCWGA